jgi:hypothetical protein
MDDQPDLFNDTTPRTSIIEKIYTMPSKNFQYWDEFYIGTDTSYGLDGRLKVAWTPEQLKKDNARFNAAKVKFRNLSAWMQKALKTWVETKHSWKKKPK